MSAHRNGITKMKTNKCEWIAAYLDPLMIDASMKGVDPKVCAESTLLPL
jgi:hypothetical protein